MRPVPVRENLFLAPECVFVLGMVIMCSGLIRYLDGFVAILLLSIKQRCADLLLSSLRHYR